MLGFFCLSAHSACVSAQSACESCLWLTAKVRQLETQLPARLCAGAFLCLAPGCAGADHTALDLHYACCKTATPHVTQMDVDYIIMFVSARGPCSSSSSSRWLDCAFMHLLCLRRCFAGCHVELAGTSVRMVPHLQSAYGVDCSATLARPCFA